MKITYCELRLCCIRVYISSYGLRRLQLKLAPQQIQGYVVDEQVAFQEALLRLESAKATLVEVLLRQIPQECKAKEVRPSYLREAVDQP